MKIVIKFPAAEPEVRECDHGHAYEKWCQLLGCEVVEHLPYSPGIEAAFDEEGKLKSLPPNTKVFGRMIVGPIIFSGYAEGNWQSLTPDQIKQIIKDLT